MVKEKQMMKTRGKPILASAAIALSLAACQWMGGSGAGESQQTGSARYPSGTQPSGQSAGQPGGASAQQAQAVSPDVVRNVQRTLSERGYDAGPADGIYGESTQQALRNFQRDQRLTSSGQLDSQTLAALGVATEGARAATGPAQQGYQSTSRRGAMMEEQRQRQQAAAPRLSSERVRELQRELASRGYDTGPVDGRWGRNTQQALSQFQQDQNLPASGRPDQRTMAALGVEGAGTQTGEMPAEGTRSPQPGGTQEGEMRRQEGMEEGMEEERLQEETGQLPETQAPGEPALPIPEDVTPQATPSPGETR